MKYKVSLVLSTCEEIKKKDKNGKEIIEEKCNPISSSSINVSEKLFEMSGQGQFIMINSIYNLAEKFAKEVFKKFTK